MRQDLVYNLHSHKICFLECSSVLSILCEDFYINLFEYLYLLYGLYVANSFLVWDRANTNINFYLCMGIDGYTGVPFTDLDLDC